MAYALGIDLGTTYAAAAVWRDGRAETVPLADRAHSIPSALYLREDGVMLVGEAANRRGTTDPNRVAREFKRRLGDEQAPLLLGDTEVSAQDLTGYLLRWVIDKVTEREGARPAHVTLTCPATWGDYRRQLMTEAAATAQLTDVGLLPEPVAAAVYYASLERLEPGALVAVYDLGGGTFDATVVRKTDTGFDIHGVAGGDDSIGGTDFDQVVMDHVAVSLGVAWMAFDADDPAVLAGLAQVRANAIGAKEALSTDVDATIPIILPDLTRDVRITRSEFEAAIRIPVLRTVDTLAQTIAGAGVDPADLRAVLLVGGSSRIPLISRLIASELGVPVAVDAHPKYAVCLGAAISAGSRLAAAPPAPPRATVPGPAARPAAGVPAGAAAGEPESDGMELLAAAPDETPPPTVDIDLASAGITTPLDVLLRPVPDPAKPLPHLTGRDEPLTIAHTGDVRRGRRIAILVSAGAAVLLLLVSALGAMARSTWPRADPTPGSRPSATGAPTSQPAAPAAALRPQAVPQRAGDVMHAVAAAPGGGLVAVGASSTDGVPRAWRYQGGTWSELPGPNAQSAQRGEMNGVAASAKAGLVAVGWVAPRADQQVAPAARRPAIWTSTDGSAWNLLPAPAGGSGRLGELTDVAVRADGGFVAAGTDWDTDTTAGDGAVLTSSDGKTWQRVTVRGLDGPGPSTLRRLLTGPAAEITAVGTRLDGSASRSVVWSSPDAQNWSVVATLGSAGAALGSAWGLTRMGDGLVVTGFGALPDGTRKPLLWSGRTPESIRPITTDGAAGSMYAAIVVDGSLTAIGAGQSGTETAAAAWTVQLP